MFKWLEQQTPIIDFSFFVKKYKYLLCKKILQGIYFLWVQIEKKRFLAKNLSVSLQKGNKDDGRRCLVGHDGAVVLWDELCRQSLHGWVGGTGGGVGQPLPLPPRRISCSLVGCVLQGVIFSDLWPYQRVSHWVLALRRYYTWGLRGAHLPHPLLSLPISGEEATFCFLPQISVY